LLPLVKPFIAPKEELMSSLEKILYSGYIAEGEAVYEFERCFGEYVQNPYSISTNSGTAALHIALIMAGIQTGDEVISTALTAEPTNISILLSGGKVVFADVDGRTGLLDPKSVREKISERTKAIMLVHYAGMVCDMDAFNAISKEYSIPIIEDTAHALGSRYCGKPVGSNSDYTCFSFQAIKHMTTVDGGMLTLKREEACNQARKLRWFGLDKKVLRLDSNITDAVYKYHMNNVNATIGLAQLRHIHSIVGRHIDNGRFFDHELKEICGINLIPYYPNTEPSYWLYTFRVENRADFIRSLEESGISASQLHLRNDRHSVFGGSSELSALERFYQEFVHIPCGWWVTDEDRQHIVDSIRKGW
jgi:dTDP-4-amino-4,6-dideoxygalactose transaminase